MPLTYAICLFFVAGICEFLRRGVFDLTPFAAAGVMNGALALCALAMIGRNLPDLIRQAAPAGGARAVYPWTWPRTAKLLTLVPILWALPALCGSFFTGYFVVSQSWSILANAFLAQTLIFALAYELFFREAALKVFAGNLPMVFTASIVGSLVFSLPLGVPAAVLTAGASAAYMALRVAGMNIFVVALIHGASRVLFGRVLLAEVDHHNLWLGALGTSLGYLLFAAGVLAQLQAERRPAASGANG